MINFIKKMCILIIHLFIKILFFTYKIIHEFIEKNKDFVKNTLEKIDEELLKMV